MSMSLPSGSEKDLVRVASASQRRATLSYQPQTETSPLVADLAEKTLVSVQVSAEGFAT